jgi:hypothetical protein
LWRGWDGRRSHNRCDLQSDESSNSVDFRIDGTPAPSTRSRLNDGPHQERALARRCAQRSNCTGEEDAVPPTLQLSAQCDTDAAAFSPTRRSS